MFPGENSGPSMNFSNAMQQSSRSVSPPPLPVLSMTDKAAKMELEAVLRQPSHTPEEKYNFTAIDLIMRRSKLN